MKVLIACECSGVVRRSFAARGHMAVSCDLLPSEEEYIGMPIFHVVGDILSTGLLNSGYDLLIAHPPCTYLCNAGVRHLHSVPTRTGKVPVIHGELRRRAMIDACEFFLALWTCPIPRICIENPTMHHYALERIGVKPTQAIQPYQFGHGVSKRTCLWLKNLPPLKPTTYLHPNNETGVHRMSPSPERSKLRSITYRGVAIAMAEQWGSL